MRKRLIILFMLLGNVSVFAQSAAIKRIQHALPTIKDSLQYVDSLNKLCSLFYDINTDSSFYYARRTHEMAERLYYKKGRANGFRDLSILYMSKGNLELALRYSNDARNVFSTLKDSGSVVRTLVNMSQIYNAMGKNPRAVDQIKQAMVLSSKLKNKSLLAWVLTDYVILFPSYLSEKTTSQYIREARAIALKNKDNSTLVELDQVIARRMIHHNQREEGIALLKQTLANSLKNNMNFDATGLIITLGDVLSETDPAAAVGYYQRAFRVTERSGYFFKNEHIVRSMIALSKKQNNLKDELTYSRLLLKIIEKKDSLNRVSGVDYIDYALKDQQVQSLRQQSNYKSWLLALACAIVILALAVIWVGRNNLIKTRLLNNQISQKNVEMQGALHALEQSQEDNTRMMQIVAHDLRNPIGGITSIASLMLEDERHTDDDRMMLELIKTSGKNSLDLVSDLLQVHTRIEELKREQVDLDVLLRYCVDLLRHKAEAKGQRIELRITPAVILANGEKLWRVVSNLVANAIKFSPSGAGISVGLKKNPGLILIFVKDQGIGIPPEIKDKVFDMFTDAKRPGTGGEQPFGLGLAISRQIVEAHGGRIWFDSKPDEGTTFFVELPC